LRLSGAGAAAPAANKRRDSIWSLLFFFNPWHGKTTKPPARPKKAANAENQPMPVNKPHLEFHRIDMASGWSTPPGYPPGIEQKILAGALDEQGRSGNRTRLLRFAPGVFTTEPFVHEYWEEVYLIEGDLTVGNDTAGRGGENFPAGTYACRPPGAVHGPFKSNGGCLLYEIHYYAA
jgi:hypothetical protein